MGDRLRICLLTRSDLLPANHGAAVKIVRTAEHLSRLGEPVCVVTDDRDRYWRFVEGRAELVSFSPRFRAAEEWPPLPRLGRLATRLCDAVGYPREEHFLYTPQFDPAWWARAVQVGRVERVDVFQAEFPGYGVPAWIASRVLGARSSVVQHNVEWDRLAEFGHDVRRIRAVEQAVLAAVDEVVAVSAEDKARMVGAGLDHAKVTIIPHGVDVATFSRASAAGVRARHGIDESAPLLFFHGTLHYWPNTEAVRFIVETLLPRLLPRFPDLRVLICGLNPPTYYSHPAVVFAGPVDDLAEHVAAADLCVCPLSAGGGTRLKLLEYMASGKATVSTTKGAEGLALRGDEMVIADGAGPFAEAVAELLSDLGRRRRLGAAAAAFAARYDWPAIAAAYRALYRGEGRGADWNALLPTPAPRIDAHLPARVPSKPLTLLLLVNRGCNLRCAFCDLWDDPRHMPLERAVALLDEAVAIGTCTLVLTGGEPLLHPDLWQVVRAAKARGLSVNVTTNGTLVEKRWDEVVGSGVDSLSFSLDGLEATHDRLRGQRGAWKKTLAALRRVVDHGGIGASVYFTATRANVSELTALFDLVLGLGAGFDFWPVNDSPDLALREADRPAWEAAVAHISEQLPDVAARAEYYRVGLGYRHWERAPVRCLGLVDQYGVKYDGTLLPCCVWEGEDLAVGNVFETPLGELWWSAEVQAAREAMLADGCTAGCFNHSLYEFTASTGLPFALPKRAAAK